MELRAELRWGGPLRVAGFTFPEVRLVRGKAGKMFHLAAWGKEEREVMLMACLLAGSLALSLTHSLPRPLTHFTQPHFNPSRLISFGYFFGL